MIKTVADYSHGRDNNFNLLRAIAASLVILTHACGITGHNDPFIKVYGVMASTGGARPTRWTTPVVAARECAHQSMVAR